MNENNLISIPKEKIDDIFISHLKNKNHQSEVFFSLYEIPIPNVRSENIESISGWPKVNRKTNEYIMKKFINYDIKIHPDVVPGGLWMNSGFSDIREEEELLDWKISMENCKINYKTTNQN